MAKKNKFSRIDIKASLLDYQKICPEMRFKISNSSDLPGEIPSDLSMKFETIILASSGNADVAVYFINGARLDFDNGGWSIDEEPFMAVFNKKSGRKFGGFIHHGSYNGRKIPLTEEEYKLILDSGIGNFYPYKERIPSETSGDIKDLGSHPQMEVFKEILKQF